MLFYVSRVVILVSVQILFSLGLPFCKNDNVCISPELSTDLNEGRLPLALKPTHYNIELQPDIFTESAPFNFTGKVEIFFEVRTVTNIIWLNQLNIVFNPEEIEVTVAEDSPVQAPDPVWTQYEVNNTLELFGLQLEEDLVVFAIYKLTIGYGGPLQPPVIQKGLYWDKYITAENETRYLVASQFQSSDARRMMPCFDEPYYKSTHNVTLVHQESHHALTNTELLYQEQRDEYWIADVFNTSPIMSCYLLCFVISDFVSLESVTSKGVLVRVWAREEAIHAAEMANNITAPTLEWFETYTNFDYVLPKFDHVAIPSYQGAMENWGLATYSENLLLYDPDIDNSFTRQLVAEVSTHEIAHMWFGNLITCLYWNETWLNEGFANYYQFQPLNDVLGWSGYELQIVERMLSVIDGDSKNSSTKVRMEADNKEEGEATFNSYTYGKGGGMLRMISQFIGNDTLAKAMQRYLQTYQYNSATTENLWSSIYDQIEEDDIRDVDGSLLNIQQKMDPWVSQRGLPVVTVTRPELDVLQLSQEMFFNPVGQEAGEPSPFDYMWNVPVTYYSESDAQWNTTTKEWMDREQTIRITEAIPPTDAWFILNPAYTGWIRVFYMEENQRALVEQLINDFERIPIESRTQLITDAFQLARAEFQLETQAMEFTRYLSQDVRFIPWYTFDRNMEYQTTMLSKFNDSYNLLENYVSSLVDPIYEELGWRTDAEPHFEQRLRQIAIKLACAFNIEDCLQTAQELFLEYQDNPDQNPIHPDQRLTVYCTSVKNGEQEQWDWMYNRYQSVADAPYSWSRLFSEKRLIIPALACTSSMSQMESYLDLCYDVTSVRKEDAQLAISSIATSDIGRPLVWQKLEDGWTDEPLPDGVSKNTVFNEIVSYFNTPEELNDLLSFIEQYPPVDETESNLFKTAVETVELNLAWINRNLESLNMWYEEQLPFKARKVRSLNNQNHLRTSNSLYSIVNTFANFKQVLRHTHVHV